MRYQDLALLAVALTSVSAFPTEVAKREFTHDAQGNIKLTCTLRRFVGLPHIILYYNTVM